MLLWFLQRFFGFLIFLFCWPIFNIAFTQTSFILKVDFFYCCIVLNCTMKYLWKKGLLFMYYENVFRTCINFALILCFWVGIFFYLKKVKKILYTFNSNSIPSIDTSTYIDWWSRSHIWIIDWFRISKDNHSNHNE